MSNCSNCGATLPQEAQKCSVCGQDVGGTMQQTQQVTPSATTAAPTVEAPAAEKKKKGGILKKLLLALVVIIVIGAVVGSCSGSHSSSSTSSTSQDDAWPTGKLAQMIPAMNHACDYVFEGTNTLSITVKDGITQAEYDQYVSDCKDAGFTVEAEETTDSYNAFNDDGYELDLYFTTLSTGNSMNISLDAPETLTTITWPTSGPAALIPNPGKTTGKIQYDTSDEFYALVGEMPKDEFGTYVNDCMTAGFAVDYSRSDTMFMADDATGNSLTVEYKGNGVVSIHVKLTDEPEQDATEAPAQESAATETPSTTDSSAQSSNSSDFREFMDGYEAYMDSYIEFMQKYNNSSNTLSMATDYAKMLADYYKWVEKIDDYDTEDLSDSDYAYYIEVTTRVNKKLTDAAVAM
jgi:hypothetical protein